MSPNGSLDILDVFLSLYPQIPKPYLIISQNLGPCPFQLSHQIHLKVLTDSAVFWVSLLNCGSGFEEYL